MVRRFVYTEVSSGFDSLRIYGLQAENNQRRRKPAWLVGRVDDCSCLESNRTERYRGFESYTSRVVKVLDDKGLTPILLIAIGVGLLRLGYLIQKIDKTRSV